MMKVERARIILVPDRVYLYPAGYLVYPDYNRRVVQTSTPYFIVLVLDYAVQTTIIVHAVQTTMIMVVRGVLVFIL